LLVAACALGSLSIDFYVSASRISAAAAVDDVQTERRDRQCKRDGGLHDPAAVSQVPISGLSDFQTHATASREAKRLASILNQKFTAFDQVFAGALRRQKRSID
jgi:hypothetical protein